MRSLKQRVLVLGVVVALGVPGALAAPGRDAAAPGASAAAARAFQSLFGQEVKRARATRDTADDVALAAKLLDAARSLGDDPALQSLVVQTACELAWVDADGAATLDGAAELLTGMAPAQRVGLERDLLTALERDYRKSPAGRRKLMAPFYVRRLVAAADLKVAAGEFDAALGLYQQAVPVAKVAGSDAQTEVKVRIEEFTAWRATAKKIDALKSRIEKDPADGKAAVELVRLLLVEADQPTEAGEYLKAVTDPGTRTVIKLATRPVDELDEAEALKLGEWYKSQAASATPGGQANAGRRARACYERFLAQHEAEDAQRLAATMALKELAPAPVRTDGPVDVLALVDPKLDAKGGTWTLDKRAGLVSGKGQVSKLRIPYQPPEEYDLLVKLTRLEGDDAVCFTLPHGKERLTCIVAMTALSFEQLDGTFWLEQPFTFKAASILEKGRPYVLRLEVRNGSVAAVLNGKLVAAAQFEKAEIVDGGLDTGPDALGVVTWNCSAALHAMHVVAVTGEGKPLERGP
jgi:hypothetical protein